MLKKHGHALRKKHSPTYFSWTSMKQRCTNPNATGYNRYGGKGIKVCDSWLYSFVNFLNDMGERPEGKTLDRIDNSKGYNKENCRWSTRDEQRKNLGLFNDIIFYSQRKYHIFIKGERFGSFKTKKKAQDEIIRLGLQHLQN